MRIAFEADPMPQFQVEQSPDSIIVVAIVVSVLIEEAFNGAPIEVTSFETSRLKQKALN